jgi:serine/threonine protein kinase
VRQLGPYVLTRKLGEGGMGEVWMGQRAAMGGAAKNVAVKTLLAGRGSTEVAREMFLGEARLSMLLTNSNIVQVFDVDEAEDGTCYMAMEWVQGLDLSMLGKELAAVGERLPTHIAVFIVGEVLKALAYAHDFDNKGQRMTIVHRDVTPHNVMLSIAGEVKLMDFGIARVSSEETSGVHIKGKVAYMPPEQLRGETREPTIDLFAVGAILHELLDGRKFRGNVVDEARLFGMVLDGEIPPLRDPDQVPPELDALRKALLAAKVEQRVATARAAHRMLAQWSGYRDAKFDLEDLVRRFMKSEPQITATYVLPNADGSQTDVLRSPGASPQRVATEVEPRPAPAAAPARKIAMLLPAALVVTSLGSGLFAVGTMLGWWKIPGGTDPVAAEVAPSNQATSSEPTEPAPAEPAPTEPAPTEPAPTEPAPTEPAPAEPAAVEPVPTPAPEPATSPSEPLPTSPEPTPTKQTAATPTKTAVTLSAPGYKFFVQLRIAGKEFTFEGNQTNTIKLKPGEYAVSYREDLTGSWRSANTITIPKAKSASLRLLAGGKVEVK